MKHKINRNSNSELSIFNNKNKELWKWISELTIWELSIWIRELTYTERQIVIPVYSIN